MFEGSPSRGLGQNNLGNYVDLSSVKQRPFQSEERSPKFLVDQRTISGQSMLLLKFGPSASLRPKVQSSIFSSLENQASHLLGLRARSLPPPFRGLFNGKFSDMKL